MIAFKSRKGRDVHNRRWSEAQPTDHASHKTDPAVALRFTAGYAHHTPCGVKIPVAVRKKKSAG
jgi:hypothetical protein